MKTKLLIVASIIITILAICINFNIFVFGNPSTWINMSSTFVYLLFWLVYIIVLRNNKNSLTYSLFFSLITLITAMLCYIVYTLDILLPSLINITLLTMNVLFISPLYGLEMIIPKLSSLIVAIMVSTTIWVILNSFALLRLNYYSKRDYK